MKQQKQNKKSSPVLMVLTAITAVLAFLPSTVLAYGPERQTYTMQHPADHVVLNSITDNPTVGDERNFVHVKEAGAEKYSDEIEIEPGKEYVVYITYHNDAASNLNESGKGIARGMKVSAQFPTEVTPEKKGKISAILSATNADPKEVWDEAYMTTKYDQVLLRYKVGSAQIHNAWDTNGSVLSQAMFSEGTYLGYNTLNGILPGCAEYSGYITYTLIAENVGASVEKTVSADGQNFYENINVKPGDEVTYKVEFKNVGIIDLTNVTFKDNLPEGLTLVEGSTYIYNNAHPDGEKLTDLIDKNGYNTGLYGKGAYATITYKAKVSENVECGNLVNNIIVAHDAGEVSDGATVVVGDCVPAEIPSTGPAEVVLALVIVTGIGVGAVYFVKTRKQLKTTINDVTSNDK